LCAALSTGWDFDFALTLQDFPENPIWYSLNIGRQFLFMVASGTDIVAVGLQQPLMPIGSFGWES
jgi:hypothetical protein